MSFAKNIKLEIQKMKHQPQVDHVSYYNNGTLVTNVCYAGVLLGTLGVNVECVQNNHSQKILKPDVYFDWMQIFQDNGFIDKETYFYIKDSKTFLAS